MEIHFVSEQNAETDRRNSFSMEEDAGAAAAFVDENLVDWEDRRAHDLAFAFNGVPRRDDSAFREAYEAHTGNTPLRFGSPSGYAAFAVERANPDAFDHVRGMGLNRRSPYLTRTQDVSDDAQLEQAIALSLVPAAGMSEAPTSAPLIRLPPVKKATPETFKTQMCPHMVRSAIKRGTASCAYGEECTFAHSADELQPRHRSKRCHMLRA